VLSIADFLDLLRGFHSLERFRSSLGPGGGNSADSALLHEQLGSTTARGE